MADGFLGRWSKRKLDLKDGKPVEPEAPPAAGVNPPAAARTAGAVTGAAPAADAPAVPAPAEVPLPTMEDVAALTPESDYAPFAARSVSPEVRNAAMKKLFTDPHYNVMDRLDIYIDDYSQPDPIPPEMLRQLASAKFLGLFDEEEKQEKAAAERLAREDADNPPPHSVAQSGRATADPAPVVPAPTDHADPDLRLQQDDAPPGEEPRGSA